TPTAVTRSTGARVAGVARARASVGVRRNGAVVQVEGALARVAGALARADDLGAVRAHENLHGWLRHARSRPGRAGDRAADRCRPRRHVDRDLLVDSHRGELVV